MEDKIVNTDEMSLTAGEQQTNGCSCGADNAPGKKQPINIFNEIAYLTEHMSNLGEEEVERILNEFLAENDTPEA
ncbi:MAG: hypothetical protein IJ121_04245 [Eubacterium sp.]|nr:hypothetical protein [Eubacterium sp.]